MKHFFRHIITSILSAEARLLLARKKPKIIAITGSVGKTSTKDALYAVLKTHMRVRKSEKSFNSSLGVPLSVLGLPNAWGNPFGWLRNICEGLMAALFSDDYPEWLVLEVGVDRPGDMAAITAWVQPDIVVLTRLPHIPGPGEVFGAPEEGAKEKLQLFFALYENGILVYNNDDERVREAAASMRQRSIGY